MIIVDSHEDIAWNVLTLGRDYTRSVKETRQIEAGTPTIAFNGHTLLGWDAWTQGKVAIVFSTLFAAPIRKKKEALDRLCYSDVSEAYRLYSEQLDLYHRLVDEHEDKFQLVLSQADLEAVLTTWEGDSPPSPRLGFVILMEGAEAIRDPGELEEWFERGVRIIGPSWTGTRFAGGTDEPGPLTSAGRELLEAMADTGMILDLSHMAEEATLQALDQYEGVIIASHSNVRSLLPGVEKPDRQLTELAIDRIVERGGVIGIVPYNKFLLGEWRPGDPRELVTLDHVVAQIDHICQRVGTSANVGIGTDFDGGFGLDKVPAELDSIADLGLIGEALGTRGYRQEDVERILGINWLSILRRALPE
jgi:membrane dipeptidase